MTKPKEAISVDATAALIAGFGAVCKESKSSVTDQIHAHLWSAASLLIAGALKSEAPIMGNKSDFQNYAGKAFEQVIRVMIAKGAGIKEEPR